MNLYCFLNGDFMPVDEAKIPVTDIGLLRSYAIFDYLRTYNGKPFRIVEHLDRFFRSANELRLPFNYSREEITEIIRLLIKKSGVKEAAFRIILTGGSSRDGMSVTTPNFIILTEKLPDYSAEIYKKGVKLITHDFQRDMPGIKTTHYVTAIRLNHVKEAQKAFDILYCRGDKVLETTRNNFFIFNKNELITSKDNMLKGITRGVVLEIAGEHFALSERDIRIEELEEADEAFITGTTKKIVPVVQIDDLKIGSGKPGDNTKRLMVLFDEFVAKNKV